MLHLLLLMLRAAALFVLARPSPVPLAFSLYMPMQTYSKLQFLDMYLVPLVCVLRQCRCLLNALARHSPVLLASPLADHF
jgi:hypothetical protein